MFDIPFGRPARRCDGVSRRDMLRVGGLTALGLGLPTLLRAEAAGPVARSPRAKSVILVYLGGGMTHHDTFDPKPDTPSDIRGQYAPIGTSVPGLFVSEKLPKMAKVMDKVSLIRSATHNNDHHETATNWVMSGRFGSAFGDFPAVGAVVTHQLGFRGPLPPYVSVPRNPSFTWELGKSAFLGGRFESFKAGDPNAADFKVPDLTPYTPVSDKQAARRKTLLETVDQLARTVDGNDQLATYDEFSKRAVTITTSAAARKAFDIAAEPPALRDRYGRTTWGQSCLLARRLVEAGTRFVTVNAAGWDHHGNIYAGLKGALPNLDAAIATLVEDLFDRGTAKETLVVVMGEFGRSPKINQEAGRDHWAPAGSLLMFGAGTKGGYVHGRTDKLGGYAADKPVSPADVAATILDAVGIDPDTELRAPDGRPISILDQGEAVRELFA